VQGISACGPRPFDCLRRFDSLIERHIHQLADVVEKHAGGGYVEDVGGLADVAFARFAGEVTRWASPPERVVAAWPSWM
jgi:hypothetical protein